MGDLDFRSGTMPVIFFGAVPPAFSGTPVFISGVSGTMFVLFSMALAISCATSVIFSTASAVFFGVVLAVSSATSVVLSGVIGKFWWLEHWNHTEFLTKSVMTACLQSEGIPRTSQKHPNLVMKPDNISM